MKYRIVKFGPNQYALRKRFLFFWWSYKSIHSSNWWTTITDYVFSDDCVERFCVGNKHKILFLYKELTKKKLRSKPVEITDLEKEFME